MRRRGCDWFGAAGRARNMTSRHPELIARFIAALPLAVRYRTELQEIGLGDASGAITSLEYLVEQIGRRLVYPDLLRMHTHVRTAKHVMWSKAARRAHADGEPTHVEHVAPRRALARKVAELVEARGVKAAVRFIARNYRIAVLTKEETLLLNRRNKDQIERDRLAGIPMQTSVVRRIRVPAVD